MRLILAVVIGAALVAATLTLPAHAAEDAKLVLVLDSSGSMKAKVGPQSKISIAKASLRAVIGKLPLDAKVGLRVYGATVFDKSDHGACTDSQLVVPIGTDNRAQLRSEIAKYKPYGETPISYSLIQAAKDLGSDGRRSILLVSDGEETCNANPCKTAAALTRNNITVKIDVVGLAVSGKTREQLQCIADKGNGSYYDANSQDDLEASLDKLATRAFRAFRPFRVTGTTVEGSTKKGSAPTLGPGQYVDQIPGDSKRLYYRIPHTIPGSTIHAGFTALVAPGGDTFKAGTVNLQLYDHHGVDCGTSFLSHGINVAGKVPLVGAQADSWVANVASACFTDDLLLEIYNFDLQGRKFELVVNEEPPVVSMRQLLPPAGTPAWKSMKTLGATQKAPVPGTSFSDAAPLLPGVYRGRILTGENQVFAVNADWGQRVQVEVDVAPRKGALARALDVSENLDVQLFSPMRGEYRRLPARGIPRWDYTFASSTDTYRTGATTASIRYTNRTESGDTHKADIPGTQYVAVDMSRSSNGRFLVPYTLRVQVIGAAGTGEPEYAQPPTPTPSPTPDWSTAPTASPTPPGQTGGSSGGVSVPAVIGTGLGAAALGVGGALLAARLRRRGGTKGVRAP